MMLTIGLIFFVVAAGTLEAVEIPCEKVESFERFKRCCYLRETAINDANVTVAGLENSDVDAIVFADNEKIEFLPVNVYKKFPNLEGFLASDAAVKKISALNFGRLSNLKLLDLSSNQIEFIPDNCFQGLIKLYKINLSKVIHYLVNLLIIFE